MNRVAEADGGGGGGGGGGGCGGTWGEDWFSSRRFTQAFRLAASRAWRPGPRCGGSGGVADQAAG